MARETRIREAGFALEDFMLGLPAPEAGLADFLALSKGWRGLPAMGTLTSLESQFHLMVSETNVIFISKHV